MRQLFLSRFSAPLCQGLRVFLLLKSGLGLVLIICKVSKVSLEPSLLAGGHSFCVPFLITKVLAKTFIFQRAVEYLKQY